MRIPPFPDYFLTDPGRERFSCRAESMGDEARTHSCHAKAASTTHILSCLASCKDPLCHTRNPRAQVAAPPTGSFSQPDQGPPAISVGGKLDPRADVPQPVAELKSEVEITKVDAHHVDERTGEDGTRGTTSSAVAVEEQLVETVDDKLELRAQPMVVLMSEEEAPKVGAHLVDERSGEDGEDGTKGTTSSAVASQKQPAETADGKLDLRMDDPQPVDELKVGDETPKEGAEEESPKVGAHQVDERTGEDGTKGTTTRR